MTLLPLRGSVAENTLEMIDFGRQVDAKENASSIRGLGSRTPEAALSDVQFNGNGMHQGSARPRNGQVVRSRPRVFVYAQGKRKVARTSDRRRIKIRVSIWG